MILETLKLCFIDCNRNFAYFTTQELDQQWGDDWNDITYEHNAGEPYTPDFPKEYQLQDGVYQPLWQLYQLHFNTDLTQPTEGFYSSSFSVEAINRKVIPWLRSEDGQIQLWAGDTLLRFVEILNQNGTLYLPMKFSSDIDDYLSQSNTLQQLVEASVYPQPRIG